MVAEPGAYPTALPGLTVDAQVSINRLIDAKMDHRLLTGENNMPDIMKKLDDSVDVRQEWSGVEWSEWVNEWVSEWVSEKVNERAIIQEKNTIIHKKQVCYWFCF